MKTASICHFDAVSVRSGYIFLLGSNFDGSGGTFGSAGITGDNWSSHASPTRSDGVSNLSAYYLEFKAVVIPSLGPWDRFHGYSLRCLSTVLDI